MLRLIAVAALAFACVVSTAGAHHRVVYHHRHFHVRHWHPRHRRHWIRHVHRRAPFVPIFSFLSPAYALVNEARSTIGDTAAELGVRRTLWCMAAVNHWLHEIGKRGSGSDRAFSALRLGPHIHVPQLGTLAVMARRGGGHVGVVAGITPNGDPILISGNFANRVREAVYPRWRILAYVVPR